MDVPAATHAKIDAVAAVDLGVHSIRIVEEMHIGQRQVRDPIHLEVCNGHLALQFNVLSAEVDCEPVKGQVATDL